MEKNWDRSVQNILIWEGGWAERPNEPGGAVNKGVSLTAFREWRLSQGKAIPTKEDLRELTDDEAKQIYRKKYADAIGFDHLASGYDYALLTAAVMSGPGWGHPEDNRPGAAWFHDQSKDDLGKLLVLMMTAKMHDKNCGPHINPVTGKSEWYGPGWSDRFVSVYDLAKEMQASG